MQPIAFRSSSKRFKRRRVVSNSESHNPHSFDNQTDSQRDKGESDDEGSDDNDVPVRRRIVQGVVQEPEKKEPAAEIKNGDIVDLDPLPQLQGAGRSQIERLMKRRKPDTNIDTAGDDGDTAVFRKQLAGCADEVDNETYSALPVEKFGARMLAAMGWKPDNRDSGDKVEKQRVQRPAGLGLGAKPGDTRGDAVPPTHRRSLNGTRGAAASSSGGSNSASRHPNTVQRQ